MSKKKKNYSIFPSSSLKEDYFDGSLPTGVTIPMVALVNIKNPADICMSFRDERTEAGIVIKTSWGSAYRERTRKDNNRYKTDPIVLQSCGGSCKFILAHHNKVNGKRTSEKDVDGDFCDSLIKDLRKKGIII